MPGPYAARSGRRAIDEDDVIDRSLVVLGEARNHWKRYDLAAEINRQLPDYLGGLNARAVEALLKRLTDQALDRPEVTIASAPDVIGQVPRELRRKSDGQSIFSVHGDVCYVLTETLNIEQRIAARTLATDAPVVDGVTARRHIEASDLRDDQAEIVESVSTSGRSLEVILGPAGSGKTRTIAAMAQIWDGQVIGLTLSENAAQVLRDEGLRTSWNIDRFLSEVDRGFTKVQAGALVVVDEASMVDTRRLSRICDLATAKRAKVVLVGDDHQLDAIDAGGMLRMIAGDREAQRFGAVHELTEIHRFEAEWERDASLRLRVGDSAVLDRYDRHGRIRGGTNAEMVEAVVNGYATDTYAGETSLALASTSAQAAELATRIRNRFVEDGALSNDAVVLLRNGCVAGPGDLVQCRKNDRSVNDPTGKVVANRDVFGVVSVEGDGSLVVRRKLGDRWGDRFVLPAAYVETHVELAYASTITAAQGRTVTTCHTLVDERMRRVALYVAMTRARLKNMCYVPTEAPVVDAIGEHPSHERTAQDVLAEVLKRSGARLTASEIQREEFDKAESLATLGPRWEHICSQVLRERHQETVISAIGPELGNRVLKDQAANALLRLVDAARVDGHDPARLITEAASERGFDDARSPAAVLHSRIEQLLANRVPECAMPPAQRSSYVERTPEPLSLERAGQGGSEALLDYARRHAEVMDCRQDALGEGIADTPAPKRPKWVPKYMGPLPEHPLDRARWISDVGDVAAYQERYAPTVTNDGDPIGRAPKKVVDPERYYAWRRADDALGNPDRRRDVQRLSDADLRAVIAHWKAVKADEPPDRREKLSDARIEAARRDSQWHKSKLDPGVSDDDRETLRQEAVAAGEVVRHLDGQQEVRDGWWADHSPDRSAYLGAKEELVRRGHAGVEILNAEDRQELERQRQQRARDTGLQFGLF
jgi:hypothetical protein